MDLLTEHELNMCRPKFLRSLDKLAKGLVDHPVCSDEVYKMAGINTFSGGENEATDDLVQGVLLNEYVKLGMKRKIMITAKGLKWYKEDCK